MQVVRLSPFTKYKGFIQIYALSHFCSCLNLTPFDSIYMNVTLKVRVDLDLCCTRYIVALFNNRVLSNWQARKTFSLLSNLDRPWPANHKASIKPQKTQSHLLTTHPIDFGCNPKHTWLCSLACADTRNNYYTWGRCQSSHRSMLRKAFAGHIFLADTFSRSLSAQEGPLSFQRVFVT